MLTEDSRVVYSGDEWDDRLPQEAPPPPPVKAMPSSYGRDKSNMSEMKLHTSLPGNFFCFGIPLAAFKTMCLSVLSLDIEKLMVWLINPFAGFPVETGLVLRL